MGDKYLKIMKPNGGEQFWLGEGMQDAGILWDWVGFDSNEGIDFIKILLVDKKLNKTWVIEDRIIPRGEHFPPYSWKVATIKSGGAVPPGGDYAIRIETLDGTYKDDSNGTFAILEAKKLIITWPPRPPGFLMGRLECGDNLQIKWKNPGNLSCLVRLALIQPPSEGSNLPRLQNIIAENVQVGGEYHPGGESRYTWVVGETMRGRVTSGKWVIGLSSMDGQHRDESGVIEIVPRDRYTLIPQTRYAYWSRSHWEHPVIGVYLQTHGAWTEHPEQGELLVGFRNIIYEDKVLFEDWEQTVHFGFLLCDLHDLQDKIERKECYGNLKKATLQMTGHSVSASMGDTAFNTFSCGEGLIVMDMPTLGSQDPGPMHTEIPYGMGENAKVKWEDDKINIDVTSVVQAWLEETRPNYGLLLAPLMTTPGKHDKCVSRYTDPVLTIELKP